MNNPEQVYEKKPGHKILLIGEKLYYSQIQNELARDDAKISYFPSGKFNGIGDLTDYTLCILDYGSFRGESEYREIFCKQLFRAIKSGVTICVVYYDEFLDSRSIGARISTELKLPKPLKLHKTIHDGKAAQEEFHSFIERWGSSVISFGDVKENAKILCKKDKTVLGFSVQAEKSQIIYLPFHRNLSNKNALKEGFHSLIDSLLTFISASQTELPSWAKENPFFTEEKALLQEKENLQKTLFDIESKIQIFDNAKSLLLQRKYTLENSLINFLQNQLELKVFREEEKYKEDFWFINENEEKIAIAEIKSASKGYKREMIHKALDHKSENDLPEDFSTLLFVNCNLQAGSWKDKEKPLSKDEFDFAANLGVLVIRVEDVVRLWEMKRLRKITKEKILHLFLNSKGWLSVNSNLKVEIKPKAKIAKTKST